MRETPAPQLHDWRTVREHQRMILTPKDGPAQVLTTYPDPLPPSCPGVGNQAG